MAQVVAIDDGSEVFGDPRDHGRVLRVHWHRADDSQGFVVLSVWRDDRCVATSRVQADDVPLLVDVLVRGLASSGRAASGLASNERATGGRVTDVHASGGRVTDESVAG